MTKKSVSIYMAATSSMAIIAPGRFVCGIVLAVEICFLMVLGLLFRALLNKLNINKLQQPILLTFVVYLTIFYKLVLTFFMPIIALQMSFILFLPTVSTFTTLFLLDENQKSLQAELKENMPPALIFSLYMLFISLLRDLVGYGTITLPAIGQHYEHVIVTNNNISACSFLATIPGALIITAVFLSILLQVERKFHILYKAGVEK